MNTPCPDNPVGFRGYGPMLMERPEPAGDLARPRRLCTATDPTCPLELEALPSTTSVFCHRLPRAQGPWAQSCAPTPSPGATHVPPSSSFPACPAAPIAGCPTGHRWRGEGDHLQGDSILPVAHLLKEKTQCRAGFSHKGAGNKGDQSAKP